MSFVGHLSDGAKKREERLRDEVGSGGFFVSRAPTWPEFQIRTEERPLKCLPVSHKIQNRPALRAVAFQPVSQGEGESSLGGRRCTACRCSRVRSIEKTWGHFFRGQRETSCLT